LIASLFAPQPNRPMKQTVAFDARSSSAGRWTACLAECAATGKARRLDSLPTLRQPPLVYIR
jgi:hypothetical protein